MLHTRLPLCCGLVAVVALGSSACLEPFSAQPKPKTGEAAAKAGDRGGDAKQGKKKKKPKQTYAQAWQRICHAEKLSGAGAEATRQQRAARVSEWIVANVSNKKARYWWIGYSKVKKPEREAYFREEAKKAGQPSCPLATLLFAPDAKATPASKPAAPGGAAR